MNSSVKIQSYLPPEKRVRSQLQQVKAKHMSFTHTNKEGIPKDLNELRAIKHREHAISFLNQYMDISRKMTKSRYCKSNRISHNSLNTGLNILGYKTRVNETNRDKTRHIETESRHVETDRDQSKHIETKPENKKTKSKSKSSSTEIKAGKIYDDEELNEIVNNSFCKLSTS